MLKFIHIFEKACLYYCTSCSSTSNCDSCNGSNRGSPPSCGCVSGYADDGTNANCVCINTKLIFIYIYFLINNIII